MAFGKLGSGFGRLGIPLGGVSAIAWPSQRAPKTTDDVTKGFLVNDVWQANGKVYQLNDNTQGAAVWVDITPNGLPLDQPGVSAVYAYGTSLLTSNTNVKALNKCFDLWRSSDQTTITVGWSANGDVDAATADAFAAPAIAGGGTCEITKWYDQSFNVGTGALNSNDATALPGWGILTPTIASGGSGMTDGTQTFTIVGTNMVPAQVSGTVTGGVLSGALIVISRGSYLNQLANGASSTYGGPGTPPTFNFTWTAQAPQWTANTVNGKRVVTVPAVYGPSLVFVAQSLTLPSSASVPGATHTVVMAAQARAVLSTTLNTLFCLGIPQTDYALELNNSTSVPGVGYVGARSANLPPHTGPAIWALQSGVSSQAISINNDAGTVTVAAAGTRSGGSVGGGAPSPSRPGADDVMAFMAWGSTLSAPNLLNVRAATAIVSNTAPQTRRNRIVCIGDSIAFGLKSANGTPWPRLIQMLGYVPSSVDVLNFGYPGGWFSGGGNHDFTANEATDWANIYSATTPLILVPIALGTNDMGTGAASGATAFARNQTYSTFVLGQGLNVKTIACTVLPRFDTNIPAIADYNALVRANWNKPISQGGLGASGLIDFAGTALMSGPSASSAFFSDGVHPIDNPGNLDMAAAAGPVLRSLLLQSDAWPDAPPGGLQYLLGKDGAYLKGADGALLLGVAA